MNLDFAKRCLACLSLLLALSCGGGGGKTTTAPSGAPQNVRATTDIEGTIYLTWGAPPSGADSYDVQARVGQSQPTKVNASPIPANSTMMTFSVSALSLHAQELNQVEFQVEAYKGSVRQGISEATTVKVPLIRPTSSTLITANDGIMRLSWVNHSAVADSIQIYRLASQDPNLTVGDSALVATLPPDATSLVDETPPEGYHLKYTVRCRKGSDYAFDESNKSFSAYRPPSNLALTLNGQQVTLTWANHSAAATKIVVYRISTLSSVGGGGQEVATLSPGTRTWVETLPSPGCYTYSVEARTPLWASVPSGPAQTVLLPPSEGTPLTSRILTMPDARQAVQGPSGAWHFAVDYEGKPTVYRPVGQTWEASTPPGATRLVFPYLCLDPQERQHSIYQPQPLYASPSALIHAWQEDGTWKSEEIASRLIDTSIAPGISWQLGPTGDPQAIWAEGDYTKPQHLEFARRNPGGVWDIETIPIPPPPPDGYMSLYTFQFFVDDSGTPHMVVDAHSTVFHVFRTGPGAWTWEDLRAGQVWYSPVPGKQGFGKGPNDFTLVLQRPTAGGSEVCLLSKSSGTWQAATPVGPLYYSSYFSWANSPVGDRMAFYFETPTGTTLVLGSGSTWTSHLLSATTVINAFPAFSPEGLVRVLCQVGRTTTGMKVEGLNVLYEEAPPPSPTVTRP